MSHNAFIAVSEQKNNGDTDHSGILAQQEHVDTDIDALSVVPLTDNTQQQPTTLLPASQLTTANSRFGTTSLPRASNSVLSGITRVVVGFKFTIRNGRSQPVPGQLWTWGWQRAVFDNFLFYDNRASQYANEQKLRRMTEAEHRFLFQQHSYASSLPLNALHYGPSLPLYCVDASTNHPVFPPWWQEWTEMWDTVMFSHFIPYHACMLSPRNP